MVIIIANVINNLVTYAMALSTTGNAKFAINKMISYCC